MGRRGSHRIELAAALSVALIASLALLPAGASASPGPARASIVGGKPGTLAEFPYIAHVEAKVKDEFEFACTGTVVAPRVVLTAGHCVDDVDLGNITPARGYSVTTGSADARGTGGQRFDVRSVHTFPGFDPGTLRGDAAILVLAEPTTAPPVALAGVGDASLYGGGAAVRVAGWGLTQPRSQASPRKLHATSMAVGARGLCKRGTRTYDPTFSPALQMCALDQPDRDSGGCFGDSGGPLVAQHADGSPVEVGIVSTGGPGCSTRLPNVFTRVDSVSSWVAEWIASVESGVPPPRSDPGAPLPSMLQHSAAEFTILTAAKVLGLNIAEFGRLRLGCARRDKSRFDCAFVWHFGGLVVDGRVAPFYRRRQDSVIWGSHYLMHVLDTRCLATKPMSRCLQTRRG
jgi:secreted trypsin-like serine protease